MFPPATCRNSSVTLVGLRPSIWSLEITSIEGVNSPADDSRRDAETTIVSSDSSSPSAPNPVAKITDNTERIRRRSQHTLSFSLESEPSATPYNAPSAFTYVTNESTAVDLFVTWPLASIAIGKDQRTWIGQKIPRSWSVLSGFFFHAKE